MKYNISKKIILDITLDSSEALMFTKGGRHTIALNSSSLRINDSDDDIDHCDLEINVQLERNEQGRFDFVVGRSKEE